MPSKARIALDANLSDVDRLLELHTKEGGKAKGRRFDLEVLNKSAIVLITSYWEAYCEDIAAEALALIVDKVSAADKLPKDILKLVAAELKKDQNELAIWGVADGKWRALLKARLACLTEQRNRRMNTPKSDQIDELFRSALGVDKVSLSWHWPKKMTVEKARAKLDRYVTLRGEIAHRGSVNTSVKKAQVVDYLAFIKRLAGYTGGHVNQVVVRVAGQGMW